jgi:hypothetical protein
MQNIWATHSSTPAQDRVQIGRTVNNRYTPTGRSMNYSVFQLPLKGKDGRKAEACRRTNLAEIATVL